MATFAADDQQQAKAAAKPPISAHPAFPAIVALWFAALFGLGSLILPAVLLERMVEATGLPAILPAAAAPLGFTARALLALGGALAGAAMGVMLARMVAGAHRTGVESRGRGAISAHEELGEGGLEADAAPPRPRRRKLALYSEEEPEEDFPMKEPLTAADTAIAFEELTEAEDEDEVLTEPADEISPPLQPDDFAAPAIEPQPVAVPQSEARPALADLGLVQLVERLGGALSAYQQHLHERQEQAERAVPPAELDIAPAHEAVLATAAYFQPIAAPEDRNEAPAEAEPAPAPLHLAALDADEDAEFAETDEDAALTASFSLPFARLTPLGEGAEDEETVEDDGAEYGSLLPHGEEEEEEDDDGATPLRRRFDPPAEPHASEADTGPVRSAEADQALRSALAALQRINGAA